MMPAIGPIGVGAAPNGTDPPSSTARRAPRGVVDVGARKIDVPVVRRLRGELADDSGDRVGVRTAAGMQADPRPAGEFHRLCGQPENTPIKG